MITIEKVLNYKFKDTKLLSQALTHKSFANENRKSSNNEKLEFIGDAVLDLVLAEELFRLFPDDDEGGLSKKRASLVNEAMLSEIAIELGIVDKLKLGRGESQNTGELRPRLLASAMEAVFGAMYLDGGYDKTQASIRQVFASRLKDEELTRNYDSDYKSRLQEILQKKHKLTPTYHVIEEVGAPHERIFTIEVRLKEQSLAQAKGKSKKEAEQKAAELALQTEGQEE